MTLKILLQYFTPQRKQKQLYSKENCYKECLPSLIKVFGYRFPEPIMFQIVFNENI